VKVVKALKQQNSAAPNDGILTITHLDPGERVAALADSSLAGADAQATIDQLLQSPELCALWHRLHQANDCLRSEEMAACEGRAEFWERFSARLEHEPTILAPGAAKPASSGRIWARYDLPGVAALAAVAILAWMTIPQYSGKSYVIASDKAMPQQASAFAANPAIDRAVSPSADGSRPAGGADSAFSAQPVNPQELRNYLAAHQQFSAGPWRGPVSVQSASFNTIRTDGVNQH
jgi:negative regulator of sigma E activity